VDLSSRAWTYAFRMGGDRTIRSFWFMSRTRLRVLLHSLYLLDISSSDFYLFGKLKDQLIGQSTQYESESVDMIVEFLDGIPTAPREPRENDI
jgi:hypothetical protein